MSPGLLRAQLGTVAVGDGLPVVIMGVLNVSPESFYPGSVHTQRDDLLRAADAMVSEGAAILDLGAMSSAPYRAAGVSEAEEADRLAGAVAAITRKFDVPVSADTFRSGVARAALDAGAVVLNDVTGLRRDADLALIAAERGASVLAMASPPGPNAADPVATVAGLLGESVAVARRAGLPEERLVLDPGVGFFRSGAVPWYEWDAIVLARLSELRRLGRPLAVGVSRKSFVGALTGRDDPADRLAGSLAATAVAVLAGAALIRTHDVPETRDAVRVAEALRR